MSKLKILYGVQGTGNGHISRSKMIIDHLLKYHSEHIAVIDICISGNFSNLQSSLNPKYSFTGLNLNFSSGQISLFGSLKKIGILKTLIDSIKLPLKDYDIIISDFEPITCWSGFFRRRKVLGIGNHYKFLSNKKFIENLDPKYIANKFITKLVSPVSKFISFDYLKEDDNFFPLISEVIRQSVASCQDHYILYLSTIDLDEIVSFLVLFPSIQVIVYHPNVHSTKKLENVTIKPIDSNLFHKDLLSCKGVICHAGFQLTSECLFLGKKLATIPINLQIEQIYNSKKLKSLGVPVLEWKNVSQFDSFFEDNFSVKLNYNDELENISKIILKHKS